MARQAKVLLFRLIKISVTGGAVILIFLMRFAERPRHDKRLQALAGQGRLKANSRRSHQDR